MRLARACLLVCGLATAATASAAWAACSVSGLEGDNARAQRAGFWFEVGDGPLPDDTGIIATGDATRLEVTCEDGTVITVGPESQADLADLVPRGDDSLVLQLLSGIIGIVAPDPRQGTIAVETPVAIAAARSTAWLVEHEPGAATAVFVREGSVAVANAVTEVVLTRGEGVTLDRNEILVPVRAWGAARVTETAEALGFGWN